MKKLLLLLGVGFFLQSCSSDSPFIEEPTVNPEAQLYDVTLEVSNFDVETKSTADNSVGRYFQYSISDELGLSSDGRFFTPDQFNGKLNLRLPKGKYKVVAYASDKPFVTDYPYRGGNGELYVDLTQDFFMGTLDFTVEDTPVIQTLGMKRPIGKINLALDDFDKLPSNIESLTAMLEYSPVDISPSTGVTYFEIAGLYAVDQQVDAGTPYTYNNLPYFRVAIPKAEFANYNSKNPFWFNMLNNQNCVVKWNTDLHNPTFNLYLYGFDKDVRTLEWMGESTKVVYKKLIKKDVQIVANQSLTITGSLLDKGVTISVNDEWDSERNEINF